LTESRSLLSLFSLWRRNLPTLAVPPGSIGLIAGLIAVAGWEIGLNMPYAIADILAVRSMGAIASGLASGSTGWQEALSAIYATLKAMPSPSTPAVVSAVVTATVLLTAAGGWINTCLTLLQSGRPSEAVWWQGVKRSWVSTLWLLILFGLAFAAVGASSMVGAAVVKGAVTGALPAGWPALLASGGAMALLFTSLAGAFYGIAVTSLTGIVAIAEPQTPFRNSPPRPVGSSSPPMAGAS
jgi:hypothetical protein